MASWMSARRACRRARSRLACSQEIVRSTIQRSPEMALLGGSVLAGAGNSPSESVWPSLGKIVVCPVAMHFSLATHETLDKLLLVAAFGFASGTKASAAC